ncbi:MAG: hypothetical protein RL095_371 [Verrucomicrobiota bacterium]|jgi:nucleoside-diphosphate-sugar epimerase
MKVLITGASGYLGRHLSRRLVMAGHQVYGLTRGKPMPPGVVPMTASIQDPDAFVSAFQAVAPEAVCHLAAESIAEPSPEQIAQLVEANVHLPLLLLQAMRHASVNRILQAGSYWQLADNRLDHPINTYALTKNMAAQAFDHYAHRHQFEVITLHLGDIIGPSDPRPKLLPALLRAYRQGSILPMSSGEQPMYPLGVADAAAAFELALTLFRPGHQRFRVMGEKISVREFVAALADAREQPAPVNFGALSNVGSSMNGPFDCVPPLPGAQTHSLKTTLREILAEESR